MRLIIWQHYYIYIYIYMEVNGYKQPFGLQALPNIFVVFSRRKKPVRVWTWREFLMLWWSFNASEDAGDEGARVWWCRDLINEESLQIVVMTRGLRLPCFSLSSRALFSLITCIVSLSSILQLRVLERAAASIRRTETKRCVFMNQPPHVHQLHGGRLRRPSLVSCLGRQVWKTSQTGSRDVTLKTQSALKHTQQKDNKAVNILTINIH